MPRAAGKVFRPGDAVLLCKPKGGLWRCHYSVDSLKSASCTTDLRKTSTRGCAWAATCGSTPGAWPTWSRTMFGRWANHFRTGNGDARWSASTRDRWARAQGKAATALWARKPSYDAVGKDILPAAD